MSFSSTKRRRRRTGIYSSDHLTSMLVYHVMMDDGCSRTCYGYLLLGKYGCSRTCYGVSMTLLPYSYGVSMVAPVPVTGQVWLILYLLRGKYDVAPIFVWGKYGCSHIRMG
ncbi:hypothetical protein E3N88_32148 [Mikania micrantha]|uniref:Uncharacterized protein n=1 Tax=Mikania micrantha TaxID=192012 RepID=A0A5N6M7M1_9ASTR|nr:hypothetical protein E3N88_32148 [Mikania micrantha]